MVIRMITKFKGKNRFLSNFHLKEILFEGMIYPSTENAYQAAKCENPVHRVRFEICSPAEAKKLGRKITIREDWDSIKLVVMEYVCRQKFLTDPERQMLLDTGDEELIEGNTWGDVFWGQCPLGTGENHLGKILMKIRDELKKAYLNDETYCI